MQWADALPFSLFSAAPFLFFFSSSFFSQLSALVSRPPNALPSNPTSTQALEFWTGSDYRPLVLFSDARRCVELIGHPCLAGTWTLRYSSSRRHAGLVQEGGSRQLLELGTRYESNLTFCSTVGEDQEKFADTINGVVAGLLHWCLETPSKR